jgi:hypothetical protein
MQNVNLLAAVVAALSSFLIGGLWYSPILFANAWMREAGIPESRLREGMGKVFGWAFVLSLVAAVNLAFFLGRNAGAAWGASAGALAGLGWVVATMGVIFLFERRSMLLLIIDGGYVAVSYTVMGLIIGVWP